MVPHIVLSVPGNLFKSRWKKLVLTRTKTASLHVSISTFNSLAPTMYISTRSKLKNPSIRFALANAPASGY